MSEKRVTPRIIRVLKGKYHRWLTDSQRFQMKPAEVKEEWLELFDDLDKAIAEKSPTLMWEAVVDHLMCMQCELDGAPGLFQSLYEAVDEYRTNKLVDGVDAINLLVDALRNPGNKEKSPQSVMSELYERLTGHTLHRETDPANGEDYMYKSGSNETCASYGLHPEVADYFGFKNQYLKVEGGSPSLFATSFSNAAIGQQLKSNSSLFLS